jgi:hypothetical protein
MNRTLINRIAKLEADRRPSKSKDCGIVVLQGDSEGDDGGQIEALKRHGAAQEGDIFIIGRRFGLGASRNPSFRPYRMFAGKLTFFEPEHLQ